MAISGTFLADFESFYGAVQKAEVSLKSFESGAGKVETSLNRVTNSLSGTKLIQDATLAAEAVDRIGGVSKLTESELMRLGTQAKEAVAKMTALGQDVPPGIQRIADAAKGAGSQLDNMKNFALSAAGAFGVAFSVGAVVQFGKSVFDSASKIHDLAEQMGISTDAVQGFKFAAEQAGSSLDTVGTAITKMNSHLAEGDKSTVKALKDAGLSFQDIRNMRPEDAFLAITDAIQQIPDPMVQSDVALKLFGKSAAELLPAIKEGFRGAADGASKMSEDTIASLEAAQDAWDRFGTRVTIVSGTILATVIDVTGKATKSWSDFALFLDNSIKFGVGGAAALAQLGDEAERSGKKAKDVYLGTTPVIRQTKEEMDAAAAAAKRWADQLSASFKKFDLSEDVKILDITLRRLTESGRANTEQLKQMGEAAAKLFEQGARLTPELLRLVIASGALNPELSKGTSNLRDLGISIDVVVPKTKSLWENVNAIAVAANKLGADGLEKVGIPITKAMDGVLKKTKDTRDELGELSKAFAELAQVAGGSLGSVVRELGTLVTAAHTAVKGVESIQSGLKDIKKGENLSGILDMTTGIIGMASAAIAAGKAIAGLFDRNKGRDLVLDFAASMGGFDALHTQLLELGAEGEKLWIALTQGVGRNNPKEAQAAIDAITKALQKKSDASEDSKVMSEAEAQATIETATAAAAALDEVNDHLKVNRDAWAAWSEDVTGFLQKLADDIRAMPLPLPGGVPSGGGAGGGSLAPSGGSALFRGPATSGRAGASAEVVMPVMLDGRRVGQGLVRVVPGVLTGAGR